MVRAVPSHGKRAKTSASDEREDDDDPDNLMQSLRRLPPCEHEIYFMTMNKRHPHRKRDFNDVQAHSRSERSWFTYSRK
jgi:hypothetical protein